MPKKFVFDPSPPVCIYIYICCGVVSYVVIRNGKMFYLFRAVLCSLLLSLWCSTVIWRGHMVS